MTDLFTRLPNQKHIGEIFTPEEYVIKSVNYLKQLLQPSKQTKIIDPCAGLGQFEYYLQDYFVIANEIEQDNYKYICDNISVDIVNNVDSLQYNIPDNISAVITNPPYSGHINNQKAKRSELWMQFIEKYFLNSNIPIGIFIIPCKWMSSSKLFTRLLKYIYLVDILDSTKFILKESKWSCKDGISARIMSGVCILILDKSCPTNFNIIRNNVTEHLQKDLFNNINILPVNLQANTVLACKYILKFITLTKQFGNITDRFLSQYHYENHKVSYHYENHRISSDQSKIDQIHNNVLVDKVLQEDELITEGNIYQSRRKRLLNKKVDPTKFRINTHYNDYKCIVATSNECWNGYIHYFPATVIDPKMIFTANYIGFWGTKDECNIFKQLFQSKEFNVMLCMIKQTQNFNSNYLWCTPLLINQQHIDLFTKELSEFKDFINTFDIEHKRSYDRSNFYDE